MTEAEMIATFRQINESAKSRNPSKKDLADQEAMLRQQYEFVEATED